MSEYTNSEPPSFVMNTRKKSRTTSIGSGEITREFHWSTQSYTLMDILDSFKLPCVVRCDVPSCRLLWENFAFDMTQPLLLYCRRQSRKILARSLQAGGGAGSGDETGEMYDLQYGPTIVIPEQYTGWFGLLRDGALPSKCYTTVECLARAHPEAFLNTTLFPAICPTLTSDETRQYQARVIHPGEVFRVGNVYVGELGNKKVKILSIGKKGKFKKSKCPKYLKCYDEKDLEVLLPFGKSGKFYEVSETFPQSDSCLRKISDILIEKQLPSMVQLIYGELPALMCYFTGVLQLNEQYQEETIVASTLGTETNMLFEISTMSEARYNIALNENILHNHDPYKSALQLCSTDIDSYVTNMKLQFKLHPSPSWVDGLEFQLFPPPDSDEESDAVSVQSWTPERRTLLPFEIDLLSSEI